MFCTAHGAERMASATIKLTHHHTPPDGSKAVGPPKERCGHWTLKGVWHGNSMLQGASEAAYKRAGCMGKFESLSRCRGTYPSIALVSPSTPIPPYPPTAAHFLVPMRCSLAGLSRQVGCLPNGGRVGSLAAFVIHTARCCLASSTCLPSWWPSWCVSVPGGEQGCLIGWIPRTEKQSQWAQKRVCQIEYGLFSRV